MNSETTAEFWEDYRQLPTQIQRRAKLAYRFWRANPSHPGLQFKRVGVTKPLYSARVDLNYRVLGTLEGDEICWYWIGPHDEYTKILARF